MGTLPLPTTPYARARMAEDSAGWVVPSCPSALAFAYRASPRGMTITELTAHGWNIGGVPTQLVRSSKRQTAMAAVEQVREPTVTVKTVGCRGVRSRERPDA
jgi:hypothetical protein